MQLETRRPGLQPHPGLHPQQRGHRARGGILRPPRSPASSSGALSTGQSWSCGSGAGGGPSNDPRAGTPLLGELGLVSLEKRRLWGDLRAAANAWRGCERAGEGLVTRAWGDRTRGDGF